MDILKALGLNATQFMDKLNLGPVFSQKQLNNPEAVKEPITYSVTPFNIDSTELSPLTLVTSMNVKDSIQLFNNLAEDKDEDNIVNNNSSSFLTFDSNSPLLKYQINIQANAGASTTANGLNVGIKTGTRIKHLSYLKHQPDETVQAAIIKDITSLPFIFSLAKVKKLQTGEALAFEAYADFGLSLAFDPTDFLAAGASALSKYLNKGAVLNLDIKAGGSLEATFSVKDNFQLIFAKTNEGKYHVLVKKATETTHSRTLGLNVEVGFSNPDKVSKLINTKIDQLMTAATNLMPDKLKEAETKLESIANGGVPFDQLSDLEKTLIGALAKRLNIPDLAADALNKAKELLAKLTEIKNNLEKDITQVARQKFKAGFAYDYKCIASNEVLIEALLNDAALEQSHKGLILMNTQPLVAASANKDNVQILNYMNSKTVTRNSNWGFSLGIGNYKIGGTDHKKFISKIITTLNNGQEQHQVSYNGTRGYTESGSLGGFGQNWWGGVDAQMPQPSVTPTVDQFDYTINVEYNYTEKKFTAGEQGKLAELLNLAGAWGIINNDELDAQTARVLQQLTAKGNAAEVNFSYHLMIPDEAFNILRNTWLFLIQKKPELHLQILANAFAAVMPYSADYAYRKDQKLKVQAYSGLWKLFFNNEGMGNGQSMNFREYAETAKATLKKIDADLARAEGNYADNQVGDNMWFGGIIRMNPNAGEKMQILVTGFQSLLENIQAKSQNYDKVITKAFQKITQGFSQSFYTKALAPYFISMANNNPVVLNEMTAVLKITFKNAENEDKTILLQKKS